MIQSKEDLLFYLEEDSKANINRSNCSWIRMAANIWYGNDSYRFLQYLRALRKYEYALNCLQGPLGRSCKLIAKIRYHRIGKKINVNINPNVVGYGFRIPHLTGGVIINCKSIGNMCTANAGVIVGNNRKGDLAVIGDYVDLQIGSAIIGGIQIGNNVVVAPNSVVVKSIPDNCVVSGVPAIIIKCDGKKVR